MIYELRELYHNASGTRVSSGTSKLRYYRTRKGLEKWWPLTRDAVKNTNRICAGEATVYGCEVTLNGKVVASYKPWAGIDTGLI